MDLYRQDELDDMMYEQAREEERKRIEEYERIYDEQRKEIIDSMHETAKRTVFSEDDDDPERPRKLLTSLMMLGMFAKNLRETGDIYGRDPLKPND